MGFNIGSDGAAAVAELGSFPAGAAKDARPRRIVLLGNPNVGKSALFNALTGLRATVSNYPGTTVEVYRGRLSGGSAEVIDSPGLNSLVPLSEDERVTSELVRSVRGEAGAVVVQVADAKNLRRALLLTLQLAQLEVPDRARAEHARRGRGTRHQARPRRPRGGARHPGAHHRRDPRPRHRRRDARARRRPRAAKPPARCPRTWTAPAFALLSGAEAPPGAPARLPLALPRGAPRPRRRDHEALRDRRQLGGQGLLAAARAPRGPPGLGLADPAGGALRPLRVRGRLRGRDARGPDGEGPLPRLPEPLGRGALLLPARRAWCATCSWASTASSRWASPTASRSCCRSS